MGRRPRPRLVHFKKAPYDVYIGRPSKWGNPHPKEEGKRTRSEAIAAYKEYILSNPELLADLHELEGKTLGCWCYPQQCHGDVLLDLLEERRVNKLLEM